MGTKPFSQRTDAKSTQKRDQMRRVARDIQRTAFVQRGDSWKNQITALGTARDKRFGGFFMTDRLFDLQAEDMTRGDHMAARAVETVPDEIMRAGFEIHVQTPEAGDEKKAAEAAKAARLDAMRRGDGRRRWNTMIDRLDCPSEVKLAIKKKINEDLASDVFAPASNVFPPKSVATERDTGKEIGELVMATCEDLQVLDVFGEAMKAERTYGGSAVLVGIRDGVKDLSKPLDYDKIQSVDWLDVLTPLELVPYQWYMDPTAAKFGRPELYWMQRLSSGSIGSTTRIPIHESRLILFPGIVISKRQQHEHWGWGDSILVRMLEALRDFSGAYGGAAQLVTDFAQAVLSIKGLTESFLTGDDDLLVRRARALDEGRSIAKAILMDADEKFERTATPVTGLSDLMDRFALNLAAAVPMPVTILMGQSPAGLNATGDADTRSWFDSIAAKRERNLKPRMNIFMKMLFASKRGPTQGTEPEKWTLKYGELWQPTAKEEAERRYIVAQTDAIYITNGVLIPEEVAISRWGGDAYSPETQLDRDVREDFDKQAEEEAKAEAKQLQAEAEAKAQANAAQQVSPSGDNAPKQPTTETTKPPSDTGDGGKAPPAPVKDPPQPS